MGGAVSGKLSSGADRPTPCFLIAVLEIALCALWSIFVDDTARRPIFAKGFVIVYCLALAGYSAVTAALLFADNRAERLMLLFHDELRRKEAGDTNEPGAQDGDSADAPSPPVT